MGSSAVGFCCLLLYFGVALFLTPISVHSIAPKSNKPHELFRGCAVKFRQRGGSETLIGYVKQERLTHRISPHRALFFGLGGNVYLGDGRMASLCEEDKVFSDSDSKTALKDAKLLGCENDKLLYSTTNGGNQSGEASLTLYEDKQSRRNNNCRAKSTSGQIYEVFGCTKELCGNNMDKIIFVHKKSMPHDEFIAEEVIIANLSNPRSSQFACVKKSCPAKIAQISEVVRTIEKKAGRMKKAPRGKGRASELNKLFRECAIVREGGNGKLESLIAQARLGKQVLFFSMAGQMYIGEGALASECAEDKYFNNTDVPVNNVHVSTTLQAKSSVLTLEWKAYGKKDQKVHLQMKASSNKKGSNCSAGSYDVYLCPEGICHGQDKLLFVKKKTLVVGRKRVRVLVFRGKLMLEELMVANASTAVIRFVREKCRGIVVPDIEEVVRTKKIATPQGNGGAGDGDNSAAGEQHRLGRMGRKIRGKGGEAQ